jgi:hypothetical protein
MRRHVPAAPVLLAALLIGAHTLGSPDPAPAGQADPRPRKSLGAGIRYSTYGPKYDPGPEYWARVGREMASHFPGAHPEAIWIVGRLHGSGVRLSFPVPAGDPLIEGADKDENEAALSLFDKQGFRVWLQVEPGFAPVEKQIHLMLRQYAHHRSVQGVGVDVEWNKSTNPDGGEPVSDTEARAWLKAARSYNPDYRLFLKHFRPDVMPPTLRDGLVFIDDSQIFPSFDAMIEEFAKWGRTFAPAPVSFQFGYRSDRPWWSRLKDPPAEIGRRILDKVPNAEALIWVDFTVLDVFPPEKASTSGERIIGVKIYEHKGDMRKLFASFAELGINTVFASEALCGNADFRRQASERKMRVFVIEPVFFDAAALKADPGLSAITSKGERAKEDWVEFVCPTREEFRRRKVTALRDRVVRLQPDGVSLDFIRYFVYWEMVHPDRKPETLPDTCYCPHCLARFSADTGITLPPDIKTAPRAADWISRNHQERWIRWKADVITSMVRDLAAAARQAKPGILVNLHAVPWRTNDFGGAIRRVAGQDFEALSRLADFISPMCYTLMLHRDASWIRSVVQDIGGVSSCPVLPSIQVRPEYPGDDAMSTADFEEAVKAALATPSRGVVFWSWAHLAQERDKMAALKKLAARSAPDTSQAALSRALSFLHTDRSSPEPGGGGFVPISSR